MHTELCDRLGIEFPIFAFTHCRDVVAAVSNAGGFGVLGAIGFSPEELAIELDWIDEHVGDHPYGVDIVIPGKYEGMGEMDPVKLEAQLQSMVPDDHRRFARRILAEHGIPETPPDQQRSGMMGWTEATGKPLLANALKHDKVRLIANALGTPPADVIQDVQASGRMIGALAGSVKHALHHKDAGLDFIVCQGTEGGGHTGEIGSIVLWPEVIDAVAPLPVLAAGGVGTGRQIAAALALGAQGVWSGTLWLTVEEANTAPGQMQSYLAASSNDTIRSKSYTGKPCRMLKNDWTDAWARPDTPDPLPMPLQMMVAIDAVGSGHRYPEQSKDVAFNPCGQIIGRATKVRKTRDVMYDLVEEYVDAVERLTQAAKV
ncbi:MAG TPA: nitronate monooxygenase [Acidimicrobiales bacterium]|nr:nitronate monooxygenase [Acidimicrobiales bacterium]